MNATPNFAAITFNDMFEKINNEVSYNDNWPNGTGYYDSAIEGEHAVKLAPGEVAKCMSPNNRKMIFVGTRFGVVVVFERFSDGANGVHVLNAPTRLTQLGLFETSGGVKHHDMIRLIGQKYDYKPTNIGTTIEAIIEAANTNGIDEQH